MDSISLEIFRSLYTAVAEEMGLSLRRASFSPNIKERRDYSCAVFDAQGKLIAQGDHMPVHLGSMPMSVSAAIASSKLEPGDVIMLNDPYAGGTHLPDVTLVAPVFARNSKLRHSTSTPIFYVANRAHHADIGGSSPGSMGNATEIYQEGLRIPPVHLARRGEMNHDILALFLANVRGRQEREGDLAAQFGALRVGGERLLEIVDDYGLEQAHEYARHLIDYAARLSRAAIASMPDGTYIAEDVLDDDGVSNDPVPIRVSVNIKGSRARIDFTGSAPQVQGPINAVEAITVSAVYYVFRCLIAGDVPASAGIIEPVEVIAPEGTVTNARPPAPVAGGNVETSQRIVDVLFKALSQALPEQIPAASQGTMNNLTIGGWDDRLNKEFAYYETIAGGMGARPSKDGLSAVHTHMTNSLNTPVEALEYAYPMRVRRYEIRRDSGGSGKSRGGDGAIREIEVLVPAKVSLLADRRKNSPWGLADGGNGRPGTCVMIAPDGKRTKLPGKFSVDAKPGTRFVIETPGGGGWGAER